MCLLKSYFTGLEIHLIFLNTKIAISKYNFVTLFFFQSAHLAMIDTLMMAYTVEMVSVEKVIVCAQQYSAFFQATDLPYDIEDAVMYWINKVRIYAQWMKK